MIGSVPYRVNRFDRVAGLPSAARCFSAALNQMTRERRRYFRYPVEVAVNLVFAQGEELKAVSTNLSEGGMAIRFRGKLPKGGISKVQFILPGTQVGLEPKADVAWCDGSGRAGLCFKEIPKSVQDRLEDWLYRLHACVMH